MIRTAGSPPGRSSDGSRRWPKALPRRGTFGPARAGRRAPSIGGCASAGTGHRIEELAPGRVPAAARRRCPSAGSASRSTPSRRCSRSTSSVSDGAVVFRTVPGHQARCGDRRCGRRLRGRRLRHGREPRRVERARARDRRARSREPAELAAARALPLESWAWDRWSRPLRADRAHGPHGPAHHRDARPSS